MNILYEGFFCCDSEKVKSAFNQMNPARLVKLPKNYHVTTEYKPENLHENLYGQKVKVRVLKYKKDEKLIYNEKETANEGFQVQIITHNLELHHILKTINKNWHITGSFNDCAVATEMIDFSDGVRCNFEFEAIFGGFDKKQQKPTLKAPN